MKTWLKGGLIVAGIPFVIYILWYLSNLDKMGGTMAGLAVGIAFFYTVLSIIPAFIIGAIIGASSDYTYKTEKRILTIWTKIGFFVGLFWPIWFSIYRSLTSKFGFFELLSDFFKSIAQAFFTILIISILVIVVSSWVFWVIGAKIKKVRK